MALVTYNEVSLPYGFITQFDQQAVLDDKGQTDWILTKFDVQVQSIVNVNYLSLITPDPALINPNLQTARPRNAADIMNVIRSRLLEPRKNLSVKFNGIELIPSRFLNIDAHNGPFPQQCTITELTNETFLFSFHVIAHYWENNKITPGRLSGVVENQDGAKVLYNRWEESVSIDECMMSTRTRSGKFMIRSDIVNDTRIADEIRTQMAITGVPQGFLRERSDYTQDPSGLAISYTLVDREVFKMPPAPAFRADGQFSTTVVKAAKRTSTVSVRLKGAKNTPQNKLVEAAIHVCAEKLNLSGLMIGKLYKKALILQAQITVDMYRNEVACSMTGMLKPMSSQDGKSKNAAILGLIIPDITTTPGSDNVQYQPTYQDRGTAGILLQAAAYYDPSFIGSKLNPQTGQMTNGDVPGT